MDILKGLTDFLDKGDLTLLNKLGSYAVMQILTRTSAGTDYQGNSFIPYSESYKKIRNKEGLPTASVDLFFSGKMLGSLTHKAENKEILLYFADKEQSMKALFNNQKREFFNLNEQDRVEMIKMIIETTIGRIT